MNPNLIFQLIDNAISLAQSQLDSGDVANTLLGVIRRSVQAYESHTGKTLDPLLIKPEGSI